MLLIVYNLRDQIVLADVHMEVNLNSAKRSNNRSSSYAMRGRQGRFYNESVVLFEVYTKFYRTRKIHKIRKHSLAGSKTI